MENKQTLGTLLKKWWWKTISVEILTNDKGIIKCTGTFDDSIGNAIRIYKNDNSKEFEYWEYLGPESTVWKVAIDNEVLFEHKQDKQNSGFYNVIGPNKKELGMVFDVNEKKYNPPKDENAFDYWRGKNLNNLNLFDDSN